jgi:hypothetical protein
MGQSAPVDVVVSSDELRVAVICLSSLDIAGSPRDVSMYGGHARLQPVQRPRPGYGPPLTRVRPGDGGALYDPTRGRQPRDGTQPIVSTQSWRDKVPRRDGDSRECEHRSQTRELSDPKEVVPR